MTLSKRERYVVLGTALVVVALGLDRLVLNPLWEGRDGADTKRRALQAQLNEATATLKHSQLLGPRWREMLGAGVKSEPAEAESQALHALRDWAEESGVAMSLLKPDRLTEKTHLPQIAFQASGSGTMESIAKLVWRIQNATIPFRITELQLAARKEGTDDLAVQMRLSTVYMPAPAKTTPRGGDTSQPTGAGR